jgi:hypothetical protein
MNNLLCVPLNITNNPFVEEINPFKFPKTRHIRLDHNTAINQSIKKWFHSFNLEINLVEIFYSCPFFVGNIHVDRLGGDYVKINWIFGGKDSSMQWFKIKENAQLPYQNKTNIGTSSLHYATKDSILIYSKNIVKPSLVQAGVPHTIKNSAENRWCVSFNFRDIDTKKYLTMDDALILFKDFLIYGSELEIHPTLFNF